MADFSYCVNSSTITPTPILEKIRIAGETGYRAIELWHDDIDRHLESGGTLGDIKKALGDYGLIVPTTIFLKGWWDRTGEEYQAAMDEIRRRLAQAAEVGAPHAIAGPPHHGAGDFDFGAAQYKKLLDVGREFGVRPVMEYLGFADEVNTIAVALEILERSGDPDATTVVDPFHCFRGGGGVEDIARLRPEQIAVSHFNDAPADPPRETQRDPDRVLPGEGVIDLKRYCDLLRQIGYDRCLSLELFREDLWQQDPAEVARIGLAKMRAAAEA
jgi:sugar phosphate isomerase/epimerase